MFLGLLVTFGASLGVLILIPMRHVGELERAAQEGIIRPPEPEENSIARVYVLRVLDRFDAWLHWSAREEFLKFVDRVLKIFERMAGRVAGQTKTARLMIQERFRVIPRESPYWKQIHAWKKTNGNGTSAAHHETPPEDSDVSNHL